MANPIEVDGVEINLDDPAAALKALRRIEFLVGSGEKVVRAKLDGDDVTYNEADLRWIKSKISELEAKVDRLSGRRRRHAARIRFV
jgi:chromosome condensin MukBEF complex kleisin-like MukF subunit